MQKKRILLLGVAMASIIGVAGVAIAGMDTLTVPEVSATGKNATLSSATTVHARTSGDSYYLEYYNDYYIGTAEGDDANIALGYNTAQMQVPYPITLTFGNGSGTYFLSASVPNGSEFSLYIGLNNIKTFTMNYTVSGYTGELDPDQLEYSTHSYEVLREAGDGTLARGSFDITGSTVSADYTETTFDNKPRWLVIYYQLVWTDSVFTINSFSATWDC
ncbi:MAG: hypothetical protein K6B65_05135 [Bacilli bacterium]|nr:hypothetical protein [Bacilli bacterium]